jgi:hypothetical protein
VSTTERRPLLTLSRPLDSLTAERLEQAGVVQARHRHVLADAETLAWNRAREAEWLDAPAALEALLRELAPLVFNDQPPPLAIGLGAALIALLAGEFEAEVVARFLADWTGPRASSAIPHAWYVWEHGDLGAPTLGWLR